MNTLLYEEDLDRAYHAEIADELEERRAELEQAIEDAQTIYDHLSVEITPLLKADFAKRLAAYRGELARLD